MKLINIGFGNLVSEERLVAIVSPDSASKSRPRAIASTACDTCVPSDTPGHRVQPAVSCVVAHPSGNSASAPNIIPIRQFFMLCPHAGFPSRSLHF